MNLMFENPNTGKNEDFLYQWDQNVQMLVELKNVDSAEAVFWTDDMNEGIRVTLKYTPYGYACIVPDILTQKGVPIKVSITYLNAGRKTVNPPIVVPVVKQAKPEGWVSSFQPEYVTLDVAYMQALQVIDRVEEIKQEIENKAEEAKESIPDDYQDIYLRSLSNEKSISELVATPLLGDLESGGIYVNEGNNYPSEIRVRSGFIPINIAKKHIVSIIASGYVFQLFEYSQNNFNSLIAPARVINSGELPTFYASTKYIRYQISKSTNGNISVTEAFNARGYVLEYSGRVYQDCLHYEHINQSNAPAKLGDLAPQTISFVTLSWFSDAPTHLAERAPLEQPNTTFVPLPGSAWVETYKFSTFGKQRIRMKDTDQVFERFLSSGSWGEWFGESDYYCAFGDSITYGLLSGSQYRAMEDSRIPTLIGNAVGLNTLNFGNGGQGFFANQYESVTALDEMSTPDKAPYLKAAKLITIAWGRNDGSHSLGTADDSAGSETLAGKLKECIEYVLNHNDNGQIVVFGISPAPEFTTPTASGWTCIQADELYKTICERYNLPFVSWRGCRIFAQFSKFTNDQVHPVNSPAYKCAGSYAAGQVSQYYKYK